MASLMSTVSIVSTKHGDLVSPRKLSKRVVCQSRVSFGPKDYTTISCRIPPETRSRTSLLTPASRRCLMLSMLWCGVLCRLRLVD